MDTYESRCTCLSLCINASMWIIRSMASTDVEERLSFFLSSYLSSPLPRFALLALLLTYLSIYRYHSLSLSPLSWPSDRFPPPYYLHLNTAYILTLFSLSIPPSFLPCRFTLLLHLNWLVREYRPFCYVYHHFAFPPPFLPPSPPLFYEYTPHAVSADYWIQLYNYILSSTPSFSSSPSLCPLIDV